MQRIAVILITFMGLCSGGGHTGGAFGEPAMPPYGPLRLVNQQPLQLLFLQPFPDMAQPVQEGHAVGHLNVALSNTLVFQRRQFTANLDLEMVRAVLDLRYGILPRLEAGVEVPFLFTYSGILDNFVEGVEEVLGGQRILRTFQAAGAFTYDVSRGDRQFIQGREDAVGLGDVVVKIKVPLLREHLWQPAVSVRAAVKFPTGATDRAFGSGAVDGGLGLLLQKTFGDWTFYINGDVTFPGDAFEEADVQPFFGGFVAVEYSPIRRLSFVAQLRGDTRPFHNTIPVLDQRLIEVLLGVNWALSRSLIVQGGLAEDLFDSHCCSADVSFFLNLTGRW